MDKTRKFGRDLLNDVCRGVLKEETLRKDIQMVYGKTVMSKEEGMEICTELINQYKKKTDEAMERLYETEQVRNMIVKLEVASQKRRAKPMRKSIGKLGDGGAEEEDMVTKQKALVYALSRPLLVEHKERLTKLRDQLRAQIEDE